MVDMLTPHKDLRYGTPVWTALKAPQVPYGPLDRDLKTDVVIIGAGISGAMMADDNFTANPYKLCTGYLNKAIERGAQVFAPVEAKDIDTTARSVTVRTDTGFTIKARYAVFTSGYEVPKQLKSQQFKIYSTWAMATKPQKSKIPTNMPLLWQAADPYLYIRSTQDGRIICGGEDEEFTDEDERNALTPQKIKKLQQKMKALLPDLSTDIDFAWSGSFGVTKTGLPLIGAIPKMQNCYAVMAFGGNGITFSRIGAEIIRGTLTGRNDPDEALFAFER